MAIIKSFLLGSVAALAGLGFASAGCSGPVINSISYCNAVDQIIYKNLGFNGIYKDVVNMDLDSCTCEYTDKPFSGPLAPLDEGLTIHFRGPLHLKRFAVYKPGAVPKKRDIHAHHKRHGHHAHNHLKRALEVQTRTTTCTVWVDQEGKTIKTSFTPPPNAHGEEKKSIHAVPTPSPTGGSGGNGGNGGDGGNEGGNGEDDKPDSPKEEPPVTPGGWGRVAFYDAAAQTAQGLVFLNHAGGQGSGTFDQKCGGLSISYMTPDAKKGSATPQILQNAPIKTRDEFIIFSDEKCDGECGFYRPGIPAYKGFGGKQKVFLFEFSMPNDVTGDPFNNDMPAIWALNSKIPRTAQYGLKDKPCSCWGSGCGELDLFEVLQDATSFVKTHYHSKQGARGQYGGGGDPNYFPRPVDGTVIYAVVFDEPTQSVYITKVTGSDFPESFDNNFLEKLKGSTSRGLISSIFELPK